MKKNIIPILIIIGIVGLVFFAFYYLFGNNSFIAENKFFLYIIMIFLEEYSCLKQIIQGLKLELEARGRGFPLVDFKICHQM